MNNSDEKKLSLALASKSKDTLQKTFEYIYQEYSKLVIFCLGKYLSDEEAIKELTNEVFLCFFSHLQNIENSIKSYLCTIAKNKALDYLTKEGKYLYVEDIEAYADFKGEEASYYSSVMNDLKLILEPLELNVVNLHVIEGYSFKEIAEKLHIGSSNANVIYFRALKKFKNSKKGKEYAKR